MKIINLTNHTLAIASNPLEYFEHYAHLALRGITIETEALNLVKQIETKATKEDGIVVDLPSWVIGMVEFYLVKRQSVKGVYYYVDALLIPSSHFDAMKSLEAEKLILQNILLEDHKTSCDLEEWQGYTLYELPTSGIALSKVRAIVNQYECELNTFRENEGTDHYEVEMIEGESLARQASYIKRYLIRNNLDELVNRESFKHINIIA
jgi:hypothetical protein